MITFLPTVTTDWTAMTADGRLLLLSGTAPTEIASAVRGSFERSETFPVLLDTLLQSGLASAPDFVLLEWTANEKSLDGVRALVRGEADLEVSTAEGTTTVTGRGVSTWSEQSFATASGLTVIVAGGRWLVAGVGAGAVNVAPVPAKKVSSAKSAAAPAASAAPVVAESAPKSSPKATLGGAAAVLADAAPAATPAPAAEQPEASPAAAPAAPAPAAPAAASVPDTEATIIPHQGGAVAAAADPAPAEESGYDHLFGDTVFVTVSGAAVREPLAEEEGASAASLPGDHDGHTVLTSDIAAMRAANPAAPAGPAAPQAVATAQRVVLAFSGGDTEVLDRPIIVGRSPSAGKISGTDVPKLVTIGGNDPDISRSHARFAIQGGTVVVTDLNSRNGTLITLPGKSPQRLRGGEPTSVIAGTIVDLGGGIVLTVRED